MNDLPDISQLMHDQKNHLTALYGHLYLLKSATKSVTNSNQILQIIERIEKRLKALEDIADQLHHA